MNTTLKSQDSSVNIWLHRIQEFTIHQLVTLLLLLLLLQLISILMRSSMATTWLSSKLMAELFVTTQPSTPSRCPDNFTATKNKESFLSEPVKSLLLQLLPKTSRPQPDWRWPQTSWWTLMLTLPITGQDTLSMTGIKTTLEHKLSLNSPWTTILHQLLLISKPLDKQCGKSSKSQLKWSWKKSLIKSMVIYQKLNWRKTCEINRNIFTH